MKLQGRIALVTGAGSGLGREMALTFAREGARVVVNDVRREAAVETVECILREGGEALAQVADVADSVEVRAMFDEIVSQCGGLDILVNNAGIAHVSEPVKESLAQAQMERLSTGQQMTPVAATSRLSDSQWRRTLSIHLDGTFHCLRSALAIMEPQRRGWIINMASVAGLMGLEGAPDYSAAKAGIIGLTKSVAREVIGLGIRVNAIAPGFVDTALLDFLDPPMRQAIVWRTPIGRLGTPAEIAAAALFLACEDSSYFVGQVLSPNGGSWI